MSDSNVMAPAATVDEIIAAINAMTLDTDAQMVSAFSKIFPAAAAAIARGHSPQELLKLLEKMGMRLHHATLRKLFAAELKLHNEQGKRVCCSTCRQPLLPMDESKETDGINTGTEGNV